MPSLQSSSPSPPLRKKLLYYEIHKLPVDVYAPCALGNEFNGRSISQLRCKIVCGSANNQLAASLDGERLYQRGILYIPDYAANAGGLINVVSEWDPNGYNRKCVEEKIEGVRDTIKQIITLSYDKKKPTNMVADQLAEDIFQRKEHKIAFRTARQFAIAQKVF